MSTEKDNPTNTVEVIKNLLDAKNAAFLLETNPIDEQVINRLSELDSLVEIKSLLESDKDLSFIPKVSYTKNNVSNNFTHDNAVLFVLKESKTRKGLFCHEIFERLNDIEHQINRRTLNTTLSKMVKNSKLNVSGEKGNYRYKISKIPKDI